MGQAMTGKKIIPFMLSIILLALAGMARAASSPELIDARATAAYWIERNPKGEEPLLSEEDVQSVNRTIRGKNDTLHDLEALPHILSDSEIQRRIEKVCALGDFSEDDLPAVYVDGQRLTREAYESAFQRAKPDLPQENPVYYGLLLHRANLRLLPVESGWFESASDTHYDSLQATALDPAEPIAVWAKSGDGRFAFVTARHYEGWLSVQDFVEVERETWFSYVQPTDFAVVTANKATITLDTGEQFLFQMGARIPLVSQPRHKYALCLPTVSEGKFQEAHLPFLEDETIHHGYLPCTENNFVRQAFRFLGDEYGWGGLDDSVDCSAFVGDVYRSMGIELPRDADTQANSLPNCVSLDELDEEERFSALQAFHFGALISNDTHIMMYLGEDLDGQPIVIQAMSSWFSHEGIRQKHYNRKVIVTTVDFPNYRGVPYINGVKWIGAVR